jgi:Amt family ammonium transporter
VVLAVVGVVYPFVMTWLILLVTDKLVGLKVTDADEEVGLDVAEHGESGYGWPDSVPAMAVAAGADNGSDPDQIAVQSAD